MPPRSRTATRSPSQSDDIERWLTSKGHNWEFREGIGLEEIDEEKSLHNQARVSKPLDKGTVERYTTVLQNGDEFPGIVMAEVSATQPLLIVDGNHRYAAMKAVERKELDGYVITGAKPTAIIMLTFEANTRHGLATSEGDRLHQALYLIDNNVSAEDAARRLGLKTSTLRSAANLAAVDRRADEARLDRRRWDRLPTSSKLRLAQVSTDEGFAALGALVLDAGMRTEDLSRAVNDVNKLKSSRKQEEYVKALRATFSEHIQVGGVKADQAAIGRQARSPRTAFGMTLGQINVLPSPESIVERMTPDEAPDFIARVEASIERLTKVKEALLKL